MQLKWVADDRYAERDYGIERRRTTAIAEGKRPRPEEEINTEGVGGRDRVSRV
ncbi:hypothetical protein [Amycolatopsis sp. NPDC051071]|uniref:hypothetical protein n=1 Tax=Amycolatopsis sp. NPDC051071 TaxID=3154637 RepID=UPI003415367A